jgi:hypothetical protein
MPDFKLISADSHVNEPPAAWSECRRSMGAGSEGGKRPARCGQGTWLVTEGLPPIGCSHFSIGRVVEKSGGISQVDVEKHFEAIRFNESFRYEDYPGGWEPSQRLKDQDADGVEAEILFPSPARFFYASRTSRFSAQSFAPITVGCRNFAVITRGV